MPHRACGPFLLLAMLAACSDSSKPSVEDSDQLNNASEMLDAAPDELSNIDANALNEATDE